MKIEAIYLPLYPDGSKYAAISFYHSQRAA